MAKKEQEILENNQEQNAAAAPENPNFTRWRDGLVKKNPNIDPNDLEALYAASSTGYDEEHEYAKKNRAEVDKLNKLFQKHPELGKFFDSVANAEDDDLGEAFLNLGELVTGYATGAIDSQKYKDGVAAKKQREQEIATKEEACGVAFKEACEALGVDEKETAQSLREKLFDPLAAYEMSVEAWKSLINMLNYDDDVAAAEIRGRNENITAQRKSRAAASDGLPHRPSPAAAPAAASTDPLETVLERRSARKKL